MKLYQVFSTSGELAGQSQRINYCPQCGAAFQETGLATGERQRCDGCGRVQYLNPAPGVTVLIRSATGEILIGRRAASAPYGNKWCLPGGYIEFEESFIDAAHREVLEETDLEIRLRGVVNVVSNHLDDLHHTLVIVLLADVSGGSPRAGDDLTELLWIDRTVHLGIDYAFEADKRIIDCYFQGNLNLLPIDNRFEPD